MLRGRVGGRVGNRDTNQPSTSAANGVWGLQEAYDALWRSSWPISRSGGFGIGGPTDQNASCPLTASFSAGGSRSGAWADPISFEWQKSVSNANMPNTGNPWLDSLNPASIYATGAGREPFVKVAYDTASSSDPLFSQVSLFTNFNDGAFDRSNSKRTFRIRRGGSLTTSQVRNGTRSFTNGCVSYYGDSVISGNFCIEGWFWFNESSTKRPLFSLGTISAGGSYVQLSLNSNYVELQRFGQQPVALMSNVVDVQDWTHIALCRSGSTVRLYVNGAETGSTTDSATFGDSLLPGNIQVYAKGPQNWWETGSGDFVDEFRITLATRYSANFTPSSGSLEPSLANRPKVIVSGAGSNLANDTFYPRATGNASWDAKQFFANSANNCCILWEPSRGFWIISRGSSSGPAGSPNDSNNNSVWLYASDGSCWSPVSASDWFYNPPSQTLSLSGLGFSDNETYYRLRAKSGFLDARSRPATLTVEPIGVAFTQEPTDQFASAGSATFTAAVAGTGQLSADAYTGFAYQWQKRAPGSNGAWTDIDGATNSTLLVAGQSTVDNGSQFRLKATLLCGQSTTVYSRTAILYVGSPTAPLTLVGTAGDSQVSLSWSSPSSQGNNSISDYIVQYSSNGGTTWTTFSDGTSTATSATVTGLTNGTGYIFRVAAVNSVGSGPFCTPTARLVPSPAGTDPYFSYVSFVSNFDGDNNSTVFDDQSLAARTVSRFGDAKISTAISKWGSSAYFDGSGDYLSVSDSSAFKIGNQDFTIEAWIYPTSVADGQTRAFATTADPTDSTGFWLGLYPDGRAYWLLGTSGSWATNRAAFSLSANQWYHVAICRSGGTARLYVNGVMRDSVANSTNVSNANNLFRIGGRTVGSQYFQGYIGGMRFTKGVDRYPLGATFTVPSAPFPVSVVGATAPDAPTLVSATPGTRQAVVSWTSPNANGSGIKDYLIQYSSNGGTSWANFTDGTSKSTTATVTGLADDTAYVFRVAAVNYIGTGPYSTASSPVSTNALPGAPASVSGTPGNGEVALSWTAPASNGGVSITDYAVQYSGDSGATWTTFADGTSATPSATVTGLTNGSSYVFRVAAITAVGTGPYSSASSAVSPTGTVPNAPTSLTGIAGDQQVSLTWASPANNGGSAIADYVVQYSSNSGTSWTTFSDGTSSTAAAVVTGLTNGTSYIFRVAATNSMGTGAYSTASSLITPSAFTPTAVILTSGTSYTVPAGATSMKAWAVCGGSYNRAGGVSYRTWAASGGTTISYSLGGLNEFAGGYTDDCTATYDGTTITAKVSSPFFSGGDGGVAGGETTFGSGSAGFATYGGAVGGNSATRSSCGRMPATDVSGLLAAVALAGGKSAEDCGTAAAFGSGGYYDKYGENPLKSPGIGGATGFYDTPGGPALVLYFT